MLNNVFLYGDLGEKYGKHHKFSIATAPESVRALCAGYPSFAGDFKDGQYQVVVGSKSSGVSLGEQDLDFRVGSQDLHIIPVASGSGGGNGAKVVIGLALLAPFTFGASAALAGAAAGTSATIGSAIGTAIAAGGFQVTLAKIGLGLALAGVANMLTPSPKVNNYNDRTTPDERASAIYNGPINSSQEGTAIPIVYGQIEVGSNIVSSNLTTEQLL